MEQSPLLIPLIVVGSLVFMVGFWMGIVWLLAALSGWRSLATHYATTEPSPSNAQGFIYGMVGWISYNGVLKIAFTEWGLYIGINPLFKIGHPSLLIPYQHFTNFRQGIFYRKADVQGVTVSLPVRIMEQIQQRVKHGI